MSDSNLPGEGTANDGALSFNDGVDAITNLFQDPETDPEEKVEAKTETEDEADQSDEGAEGEVDADAENVDPEADEADDESSPYEKGRFASRDAKVTLDDGTVTTVAELVRNNLYQRDYTRKTTEHSARVKAFEEQQAQTGQLAQSLAQQRDFLLQAAQMFLPAAPDKAMMDSDPFGYMQAKAEYDERVQLLNQLAYQQNAERSRQAEQGGIEQQQRRQAEAQRLFEAVPEFRDRKVYDQFWTEANEVMAEYGFSPEELDETDDHRFYVAMRDLVKYRKALKQAPKVKQDIQAKPKLIAGGKRMDPKAKITRDAQARGEFLRKTGSMDAGIASLMDLDL